MRPEQAPETIAERIERIITRRILTGAYAAGTRLQTVRGLAVEFDVTLPTIQRVIARLEAKGVVKARQGSGVVVKDARRDGGLGLLPEWFDALSGDPPVAAALLAGVLEVRRSLARSLLESHWDQIARVAGRIGERVVDLGRAKSAEEVAGIDLEIAATAVEATGELAFVLGFNAIRNSIDQVPHLLTAMYGDAPRTHASMRAFAGILRSTRPIREKANATVRLMARDDRRTVRRYLELLERDRAGSGTGSPARRDRRA